MPKIKTVVLYDRTGDSCCKLSSEAVVYVSSGRAVPKCFKKEVETARSMRYRAESLHLRAIEIKALDDYGAIMRTWYTGRKGDGYWEEIG